MFVFCVLAHKDKATVDPLNLDQWDFYVLSTNRLNAEVGEQKTITLGSLLRRNPAKAVFTDLRARIEAAAEEPPTFEVEDGRELADDDALIHPHHASVAALITGLQVVDSLDRLAHGQRRIGLRKEELRGQAGESHNRGEDGYGGSTAYHH